MKKNLAPEEVDAFMRQFKWLIGGAIALFVVPLILAAFYLERRFDAFESSLRYQPPSEATHTVDETQLDTLIANPVQGQVVYVPAYSHIYHGDGDPDLLTITLSIRNTSSDHDIIVKSVRYFDTAGREVKSYLPKPLRVGPLATKEYLIEQDDTSGGSGANFLVEWLANQEVSEPVIEAVMINTNKQQGISFARSGVVVRELSSASPGG